MKDYKLKQRNLRASHTLGWSAFLFPQIRQVLLLPSASSFRKNPKLFTQLLHSVGPVSLSHVPLIILYIIAETIHRLGLFIFLILSDVSVGYIVCVWEAEPSAVSRQPSAVNLIICRRLLLSSCSTQKADAVALLEVSWKQAGDRWAFQASRAYRRQEQEATGVER